MNNKLRMKSFYPDISTQFIRFIILFWIFNAYSITSFSNNLIETKSSLDTTSIDIHTLVPTHFGSAVIEGVNQPPTFSVNKTIDESWTKYYIQGTLKAEVLINKTKDNVFENTKVLNDRLGGKSLKNMSYCSVLGDSVVSYEINYQNQSQYVIFFSGYLDNDTMCLESYWNYDEYTSNKTFYNFQIWANSIELASTLGQLILENLSSKCILKKVKNSKLSKVFVESIAYKQGKIFMKLQNHSQTKQIKLKGIVHKTEESLETEFNQEFDLTGEPFETITVNSGYFYDCSLKVEANALYDQVYIADGKWKLINENLFVNQFQTTEESRNTSPNEFLVERALDLDVMSKENIQIRRYFTAKELPIDISEFNSIILDAYGKGNVKITLVDKLESNWDNQLSTQFNLNESQEQKTINISDFKNYKSIEQLKNIAYIEILLMGNNTIFEKLNIHLSNFKFIKLDNTNSSINIEEKHSNLVYPIPALDKLFIENQDRSIESVELYSMNGNLVYSSSVFQKTMEIEVRKYTPGNYILQLKYKDNSVISKDIQISY